MANAPEARLLSRSLDLTKGLVLPLNLTVSSHPPALLRALHACGMPDPW